MKRCLHFRSVLLFVALLVVVAFSSGCRKEAPPVSGPPPAEDPSPPSPPEPPQALSPITGLPLVNAGSPVAVSIDNHPDARPETALNQADIVYEVLAEGGITRYLALFHSKAPEIVGPVRSSRPYFALLAKEWGAVFAHCGGDPDMNRYLSEWNVTDANEFGYGHLYWRDNTRNMPHNLYSSVENLRRAADDELPEPLQRYDFTGWAEVPEAGLLIRYGRSYAVRYRYAEGGYERYILEGSREPWLHVDRETKETIHASNIIIQYARTKVIDAEGRLDIDLIGEGKAVFLLGGTYSEGTWEKTAVSEPTWFYGAGGQKITLAPGQTWVQIVPEDAKVEKLPAQ